MYANISRYTEHDIEKRLIDALGHKYADYRKLWNSVTPESFPEFPIHIDFELGDLCNQRCVMCPRNSDTHPDIDYAVNKKTVLGFESFKKIIDEGVPRGLLSVNLGAFSEALIHKDLFKMIKYAHAQGVVDSRIVTNGLLLGRYYNEIFDSGLVHLFVSIDANSEETYTPIRGKGFESVKKNLLGFLEEKKRRGAVLPVVRVSFVEMDSNRHERDAFIAFWREKVDMIDVQMYDNFNVNPRTPFDKSAPKRWDCRSPWARVAVLSDGKVLPCCSFNGINVPIGDIREGGVKDFWNGDRMKIVRKGILEDNLSICSLCQRGNG